MGADLTPDMTGTDVYQAIALMMREKAEVSVAIPAQSTAIITSLDLMTA